MTVLSEIRRANSPQEHHKLTDHFSIMVDADGGVTATTVKLRLQASGGILNTQFPFDLGTLEVTLPEGLTLRNDFGPQLPHQLLADLNYFRKSLGLPPTTLEEINTA